MYDVSFATLDLKCPRSTRQLWKAGQEKQTNKQNMQKYYKSYADPGQTNSDLWKAISV